MILIRRDFVARLWTALQRKTFIYLSCVTIPLLSDSTPDCHKTSSQHELHIVSTVCSAACSWQQQRNRKALHNWYFVMGIHWQPTDPPEWQIILNLFYHVITSSSCVPSVKKTPRKQTEKQTNNATTTIKRRWYNDDRQRRIPRMCTISM